MMSKWFASCQLVRKNRAYYQAFDPKSAYVAPTEIARLQEKDDRKIVYALKGEWSVSCPEIAAELAAMVRWFKAFVLACSPNGLNRSPCPTFPTPPC